jgi:hypothetical protein
MYKFRMTDVISSQKELLGLSNGLIVDMFCFFAFPMVLMEGLAVGFPGNVTFALQVCAEVVPEEAASTGESGLS